MLRTDDLELADTKERRSMIMAVLKYKMIPEGKIGEYTIPLNIVFVDIKDIKASGLDADEAVTRIASTLPGPAGISVFDMEAVTTTSDGIMVQGAIIKMAASDHGKINQDFGRLDMEEMPYSEKLIEEEPHLKQWEASFQGRKLFRGPDPQKKIIPVHNVCISGRASNNNSATEMMNIVTMEEILLPIMGQLEVLQDGEVLVGLTGGIISVGIGMTVAEQYGRVFPTRQFKAGETAHGSGEYAQTLKREIPCIVSNKKSFAKAIIKALNAGMIPGKDIGCSPANMTVAKYLGKPIDVDNIQENAWEELSSVGFSKEWVASDVELLTEDQVLEKADELIPGVTNPIKKKVSEIVKVVEIAL